MRNDKDWRLQWSLPVVCETYDGVLNDINGFHVRAEHVDAAMDAAIDGPVEEGAVGGGTGMLCHEFKGGIGTSSRIVPTASGDYTVGVLVQANYGRRSELRIDGVPVGRELGFDKVPPPIATKKGNRLDHHRRRDRCASAAASVPPPGPASFAWFGQTWRQFGRW